MDKYPGTDASTVWVPGPAAIEKSPLASLVVSCVTAPRRTICALASGAPDCAWTFPLMMQHMARTIGCTVTSDTLSGTQNSESRCVKSIGLRCANWTWSGLIHCGDEFTRLSREAAFRRGVGHTRRRYRGPSGYVRCTQRLWPRGLR